MLAFKGVQNMMVRNVRLASTVVGTMKEAVQALPYKNAVKFVNEKEHFNYTTFFNKVRMVANGFYEMGLKPGDSVMTWTDNRSETLASFYACAMTGLRCVTVSPEIKEADVLVDILNEVKPSTLIYNPTCCKEGRECVLSELIPELKSADGCMMMEPLQSRAFPSLHTVVTTAWDHSALDGVLNYRALLVDQVCPDLVAEVSKRLENDPETVLLRSYGYNSGIIYKSKDLTNKQIMDGATRVANKLNLTADSIVGLDLPMFFPISLMTAVACVQKNAMFVVPEVVPTLESTKDIIVKEQITSLLTSEKNAVQIKQEKFDTLKNGLYPTECNVCKPTTGLKTINF